MLILEKISTFIKVLYFIVISIFCMFFSYLFLDAKKTKAGNNQEEEDKNLPGISLEEMLDDLTIDDVPMES